MTGYFTITDSDPARNTGQQFTAPQAELPKIPIYANKLSADQLEQCCLLQSKLKQAGLSTMLFEADMQALQNGLGADQIITMRVTEEAISLIHSKCDVFVQAEFGEEMHLGKMEKLAELIPASLAGNPISASGIALLAAEHDPYCNGHTRKALGQPPYAKIKNWAQEFSPLELLAEARKCLDKNVVVTADIIKPKSDLVRSEIAHADTSFAQAIKLHENLGLKKAKPALGADDASITRNFADFAEKFKHGGQSEAAAMLEPQEGEGRNLLAFNLTIGANLQAALSMNYADFDKYAIAAHANPIVLRDNLNSALFRIRGNLSKISAAVRKDDDGNDVLQAKLSGSERDILLGLNKKLEESATMHPEKADEIRARKLHPFANALLQEAFMLKTAKASHPADAAVITTELAFK